MDGEDTGRQPTVHDGMCLEIADIVQTAAYRRQRVEEIRHGERHDVSHSEDEEGFGSLFTRGI